MSQESKGVYEFGPFRLDADQGLLSRSGEQVPITPKVFDTLLYLVRHAGRVVPREELMEALWQDRTVADANLTQNVWFLRKALRDEEDGVRYVETIPRRGYRFVAAVTAVTAATPGSPSPAGQRTRRPGLRTRVAIGIGGALLLLAFAAGPKRIARWLSPSDAGGAARSRRSVAVLGLRNLSGRPEAVWLSTALSEMLTTELAAGGRLRVIPGESVARMRAELALSPEGAEAPGTLARIRANLGTDLVVLGSFTDMGNEGGDRLRLDLRVLDAADGETLGALGESGKKGELFDLVARAGARLRVIVKVAPVSPAEASGLKAALPSSPEAARLYADGLESLRGFDARSARERLEKAVALEPDAPLVHSALSAASSALGYEQRAKEEARRAFDLSGGLPREDRLVVEGRFRETTRDWDGASNVYRALFGFFPDNLEYGLRLASVETSGGKGREALKTVESLRRLPAPDREDPRIDLEEGRAADALGDYRRQKEAAGRAAAKGRSRGSTLLVAQARLQESAALDQLGELAAARGAGEEALRLFRSVGDRRGAAQATDQLATVLTDLGDFPRAKQLCQEAADLFEAIGSTGDLAAAQNHVGTILLVHEGNIPGARERFTRALALYRETGNLRKVAGALNNLAIADKRQGNLEGAGRLYVEALAVHRQMGDLDGVSRVLNNLAIVLLAQGKLPEARGIYEDGLKTAREVGDRANIASALDNLALLSLELGEPARAHQMAEEAVALARQAGHQQLWAFGLSVLGDVLTQEGDLPGARARYEEALGIQKKVGQKGEIANTRLALASLALEEARAGEAESEARACAIVFVEIEQPAEEVHARLVLARSLLAKGDAAAATAELDRTPAPLKASQSVTLPLEVSLVRSSVLAARSRPSEAVREAEAALRGAERLGSVLLRMEARLELGRLRAQTDAAGAGRPLLASLAAEAAERGYGLLARKARAMASAPR